MTYSNCGVASREHSFRLIAAVGRAKMLQHFEMNEWWSVDLLQAVYDAMSSNGTLTLDGGHVRDGLRVCLSSRHRYQNPPYGGYFIRLLFVF